MGLRNVFLVAGARQEQRPHCGAFVPEMQPTLDVLDLGEERITGVSGTYSSVVESLTSPRETA